MRKTNSENNVGNLTLLGRLTAEHLELTGEEIRDSIDDDIEEIIFEVNFGELPYFTDYEQHTIITKKEKSAHRG